MMIKQLVLIATAWLLAAAFASTPAVAQAPGVTKAASPAKAYTPPRTAWGDPDLQGAYTNKDESGIPFERPNRFDGKTVADVEDAELAELIRERAKATESLARTIGGASNADTGAGPPHWYENYNAKNSRPWLIVDPADGKIPAISADGQQRARVNATRGSSFGNGPFDSHLDFSLYDRCITRGLPGSMMPAIYGMAYEIVQAPGFVAIRYEMIHEIRIIPLNGRPHLGAGIRQYMGDARGRFEGKTLVVETTNFKPLSAYRESNPDTVKLIERFTPIAPDKIEWSMTIDDPTTYAKPWTFAMNLTKDETQGGVFEYACHEGNYGLPQILSAARASEK
jgi:hypothetical protein